MGRNNEKNIKKHNDKLHKAKLKQKSAEQIRRERLSQIVKKFHSHEPDTNKPLEDGK